MVKRLLGGIALCACLLAPAGANPPTTAIIGTPPQPSWSQLSPAQHVTLAPLVNDWDQMDYVRRKKWLLIAERYSTMKPEEQKRVQERMREWARMTPEQRTKVRDSYKEFNQLPPEQKQVVKEKWETYRNLPEEEKARIKQGGKATKPATPAPAAPEAAAAPTGPAVPSSEPAKP